MLRHFVSLRTPMVAINNETQNSIFSLIRTALLANATLSKKFTISSIYQFEPKTKSMTFKGYPLIWANVPSSLPTKINFDNSVVLKDFEVDMFLRMTYDARDNYVSYTNAIIKAIEDYESTFQSSGYYDVMIELADTDPNQVIDQKEIVEGYFVIRFKGQVQR